jgi:hypothetical protein
MKEIERMKIVLETVFVDVWELLVHDFDISLAVDDYHLEEAINERIKEHKLGGEFEAVRLLSPRGSGLSRWKVQWSKWADEDWQESEGRISSVEQARESMPADVAAIIDWLNATQVITVRGDGGTE